MEKKFQVMKKERKMSQEENMFTNSLYVFQFLIVSKKSSNNWNEKFVAPYPLPKLTKCISTKDLFGIVETGNNERFNCSIFAVEKFAMFS